MWTWIKWFQYSHYFGILSPPNVFKFFGHETFFMYTLYINSNVERKVVSFIKKKVRKCIEVSWRMNFDVQMIENDMVEQVQRFDSLTECGQQIVQYVDNETAVLKISSQLESFQERWEKLVQQMETHSKKVRQWLTVWLKVKYYNRGRFAGFVNWFNSLLNRLITMTAFIINVTEKEQINWIWKVLI